MIQVPGYLIKKEIGVGGMATVFLAVQTSLEREVALKVMNPAMVADATFSKRFMQEARTLASLSHPNIVAVYDVGITPEKLHYFSMQHLPNGDFFERIKDGVSDQEILRVFAGVARALGYAHQRGFVHRDVAPGNIMYDINNNPVLTDFGIARTVSKTSRITNAGVSVGTSHYMSPEQARGGDVDGRSDIYSMGAAVFESLTGSPPYTGEDGFAIAYAHVFEPVPRLPPARSMWQALIDRSMAKDPAQRFQNTDEFLVELARVEHQLTGTHHADPVPKTSQQSTVVMPTLVNSTTPMVASNPENAPLLEPMPQPKVRPSSGNVDHPVATTQSHATAGRNWCAGRRGSAGRRMDRLEQIQTRRSPRSWPRQHLDRPVEVGRPTEGGPQCRNAGTRGIAARRTRTGRGRPRAGADRAGNRRQSDRGEPATRRQRPEGFASVATSCPECH
ncbi:MAG: serine/threonine protein kinase [Ahniella sp.]|nr:serine/threonine protein kinase [Ahniella sp.]